MSRRKTWPITPAPSTRRPSPILAGAPPGAISAARRSMAKTSRAFVCQACGAVTTRWSGKCAACGECNSIIEEAAPPGAPARVAIRGGKGRLAVFETLAAATHEAPRLPTGIAELDRVLGGGLVPGSAVLVAGAPGPIPQLRGCASALISHAKGSGSTLALVGHVTKDGQIAGPKVIEHMVDTVLSFEGLSGHQFRILRAVKNRFGPTDEIGVFEMRYDGLQEVENPSALFLSDRETQSPGTAVFAGMEGTRPILVEMQALIAPSPLGTPRRAVVGWDPSRLSMLIAVLEARCGIRFSGHDVYLN